MLITGAMGAFQVSVFHRFSKIYSSEHSDDVGSLRTIVSNKKLKTKTKLSFNRGEAALEIAESPSPHSQAFGGPLPWVLVYLWPPGGRKRPEIQTGLEFLNFPEPFFVARGFADQMV